MSLIIKKISVGLLESNCFIVSNKKTGSCVIIDPGDDFEIIDSYLQTESLKPEIILLTHGHLDHIMAATPLKDKYKCKLGIHKDDLFLVEDTKIQTTYMGLPDDLSPPIVIDLPLKKYIKLDGLKIRIIHTPGHSPGSVSFLIEKHLFSGDTLFRGSIGRSDLWQGDFQVLISSIRRKLFKLNDDIVVHPGHGEDTTIGLEKRDNPFL